MATMSLYAGKNLYSTGEEFGRYMGVWFNLDTAGTDDDARRAGVDLWAFWFEWSLILIRR